MLHSISAAILVQLQLFQFIHLPQEGEHLLRLLFVDHRQGKADVDEDVLAHLHLGHVVEADPFRDAAEIDFAHEHVVFLIGLDDFSRYCQTHVTLLLMRVGIDFADHTAASTFCLASSVILVLYPFRLAATANCPRLKPPSLGGTR